MSAGGTLKHSKTEKPFAWGKVDAMSDAEIERNSPPELANLPADFFDEVRVVRPVAKEAISLRVDRSVLEFFRKEGAGYQSRMNEVLRRYVEGVSKPAMEYRLESALSAQRMRERLSSAPSTGKMRPEKTSPRKAGRKAGARKVPTSKRGK